MTQADRWRYWKTLIHRQIFDSWGRKKRLSEQRPGSFPFISGDTFRECCDLVWEPDNGGHLLFTADYAIAFCSVESSWKFRSVLQGLEPGPLLDKTLVIHNGDALPSVGDFEIMASHFDQIYCVNAGLELEKLGVVPIPQGLENVAVDRSGRVQDYPRPFERFLVPEWSSRTRDVFASFRVSTNPLLRQPLKNALSRYNVQWLEPTDRQDEYLRQLKESRFVLSPQGNGPDCHRTWEAIYWGCVPVIEKGSLPDSLTREMPILVVDSFMEFLEMAADDRLQAGALVAGRKPYLAFMDHWIALIHANG